MKINKKSGMPEENGYSARIRSGQRHSRNSWVILSRDGQILEQYQMSGMENALQHELERWRAKHGLSQEWLQGTFRLVNEERKAVHWGPGSY